MKMAEGMAANQAESVAAELEDDEANLSLMLHAGLLVCLHVELVRTKPPTSSFFGLPLAGGFNLAASLDPASDDTCLDSRAVCAVARTTPLNRARVCRQDTPGGLADVLAKLFEPGCTAADCGGRLGAYLASTHAR